MLKIFTDVFSNTGNIAMHNVSDSWNYLRFKRTHDETYNSIKRTYRYPDFFLGRNIIQYCNICVWALFFFLIYSPELGELWIIRSCAKVCTRDESRLMSNLINKLIYHNNRKQFYILCVHILRINLQKSLFQINMCFSRSLPVYF